MSIEYYECLGTDRHVWQWWWGSRLLTEQARNMHQHAVPFRANRTTKYLGTCHLVLTKNDQVFLHGLPTVSHFSYQLSPTSDPYSPLAISFVESQLPITECLKS